MSRRNLLKGALAGAATFTLGARTPTQQTPRLPTPKPPQLAWQKAELGILFCYELHTFQKERYHQPTNQRKKIDIDLFNPTRLDTDQWVDAAVGAGARFAILTASHESGFRLWQSDANPFSLKSTRWGGGKRDIVGEFVASCRKAGIKPGLYMGTRWNAELAVLSHKVTDKSPLSQDAFSRLIEKEVEEICSRYGELFELWFDGGSMTPDEGGPDVLPIFDKHQPNTLFYHSDQRRDVRWGGSESGAVPYPCWATVPDSLDAEQLNANGFRLLKHGDPDGRDWCPAMSDAPLRNHEWFWEPDDEAKIRPLDELVGMYYGSVGRNSTLILGATPDTDGLMPEADSRRFRELGDTIRKRFAKPVAETRGEGETVVLDLGSERRINHVIPMEEIAKGERVRQYTLEALVGPDDWKEIGSGTCIGHKRIHQIPPVEVLKVRLRVTRSVAPPIIRSLAAYGPA